MTKNIYTGKKPIQRYLTIAIACCSLLCSCVKDDLLDRTNPSQVIDDKAWTTNYLTQLGVRGLYVPLRLGINEGGASERELYHFDRFVTSQYRDSDPMMTGNIATTDGMFWNVWKEMYEGIDRTNIALQAIPAKSESPAEAKAQYIAEAKFLRAYYYHRLNQVFKGVPLYEEPIVRENAAKTRESEETIWKFIIKDLTDCIDEVNFPNNHKGKKENYGKASKGAAYALRGKAYMYLKEYGKAIEDFGKVKTCGYDLFNGAYVDLFKEDNEDCEEMIFSIQNIGKPGLGSTTHFFCGHRTTINGGGWTTYSVAPFAVELYENTDGAPFNWDDVIPGYNSMKASDREVYFLRDTVGLVQQFVSKGMAKDKATGEAAAIRTLVDDKLKALMAVKSLYMPIGNEARLKAAYENRDPRLAANVITPYSSIIGSYDSKDIEISSRWPYRNDGFGVQDIRTDTSTKFYYLHRKFVYEGTNGTPNRSYGPIDFPLIRYADVLLMKAEALAELGRTGEAILEVNLIRLRAGVAALNSSAETTVGGQDDLVERIRDERRREFINEGISYFDELRWNTFKETSFDKKEGLKQIWGTIETAYNWNEKVRSWAIPQKEREMTSGLSQNPHWGN